MEYLEMLQPFHSQIKGNLYQTNHASMLLYSLSSVCHFNYVELDRSAEHKQCCSFSLQLSIIEIQLSLDLSAIGTSVEMILASHKHPNLYPAFSCCHHPFPLESQCFPL